MLQKETPTNQTRREKDAQGANAQQSSKLRPGAYIGDGYVVSTVAETMAHIHGLARESIQAQTGHKR